MGTTATPCGIGGTSWELRQEHGGQAVPTMEKLNQWYIQNYPIILICNDSRMILMHTIVVFGRSRCPKYGDMEGKNTWWRGCCHWKESSLYFRTPELWAFKVLPDTKHGVPWEITGTHTENVESRTVVFRGGGTHTYSGGRGYLLLNWPFEMGCPHFTDRFPWWGYYHQRAHISALCTRYSYIGEENPH